MKFLAVALTSTMLVACGGGGGGESPSAGASAITVNGAAVKGPMAKAKISLYKTNADGTKGALLTEVTSDDNGQYSATVAGYSGVILVEASVVPGQTTMYDEATGQTITPDPAFKLRASFPAKSGVTYSTQINPYTETATVAAMAKSGGLSSTNVEQSNSDMATSLTFNPLTVKAEFDATTKKPTNAAAVAVAAISEMASSGEQACTGTQAEKVTCITTALSNKGIQDASFKPALQAKMDLIATATSVSTQPISSAAGTPVPAATALEQAKAFITTLRSNAKVLDASDLSLQTELQKVSDDLKNRTAPMASSNVDALNLARLGAQFWNDVIKNPNAAFVASKAFYKNSNPYYPESLGGCGFYSDTDYMVLATSKADAKYVACGTATTSMGQYWSDSFVYPTDANGIHKPCAAIGDWCGTQWTVRVRLHPDAADSNKFTIYTQTRESRLTKTADGTAQARTQHGAAFPGNAATLVTQQDGNGRVTAVNLAGELSPAFQITRNPNYYYDTGLALSVYKPNQVAKVLGDKHNVALSGALTQVNGLDKLALSGSMELIKAGSLESRFELASGSYLQAKPDGAGGHSVQDGSHEMLLKLKGGSSASSFTGDLKIGAFKLDASSTIYIPTMISFAGSVQRNGVSFFDGTITAEALNYTSFNASLPLSNSNAPTIKSGFVGNVSIPNRPVLKVSLSATQKYTGSGATTTSGLSGQYVQGYATINVSGSTDSSIVTLESTSGIKLVIDKSKTTYPLTKSGSSEVLGEFSTSNHRLTYSDSSYEQF
jgi:hypothetical protein